VDGEDTSAEGPEDPEERAVTAASSRCPPDSSLGVFWSSRTPPPEEAGTARDFRGICSDPETARGDWSWKDVAGGEREATEEGL